MIICVPKETQAHEYRVGLTPDAVQTLVMDGHEVWVEHDAGFGIGKPDSEYLRAGANIANSAEEAYSRADLIVKVKGPSASEIAYLTPTKTLIAFLHLASDATLASNLLNSGATCIAYETVTDDARRLPLLAPMSALAGRLSVQEASAYLRKHNGGMGVLLGGAPGVQPESVVIIGGGVVGSNACQMALSLGANVTLIEQSQALLRDLDREFGGQVNCILPSPSLIEQYVSNAALVVGAVLVPGGRAARVISSDLVKKMRSGAVIVDVAIDQGGCCENSRPTTLDAPTFIVDGVIHYCVSNIPGAVPVTATKAQTQAALPYIRELAGKGVADALLDNPHLLNGVNVAQGHLTQKEAAEYLTLPFVSPATAIASRGSSAHMPGAPDASLSH